MSPRNGKITERETQNALRRAAKEYGWRDHVAWSSMNSPKGWPDLTLAAGGRLWLAVWEVKNATGKATPDQVWWLNWWAHFAKVLRHDISVAEAKDHVLEDIRISVALVRDSDLENCYRFLMGRPESEGWPSEWAAQ